MKFTVNGTERMVVVHPMRRLLDVLRDELGLVGTKEGCGEGECGACSVTVDGLLVQSCLVPVCQVEGKSVVTIEGIADGAKLHSIQQSFCENGGAQCGICTPGMIMAAVYYLNHPDEAVDLQEALAGNQCRCTGYTRIFQSVKAVIGRYGPR